MRNLLVTLLLGVIFFSACKKIENIRVVEDVNYNPEFAIPLVNSSISLQDILDNEDNIAVLEIDDDGEMTLNYEAEFEHNSVNELIGEIPSFPLVLIDTNTTVPVQVFDNVELNSIALKEGTISFNLQSGTPEDLDVTITIPELKKDGVPFTTNLQLNYQGSLPVSASIAPISIEGYLLDLAGNEVQIKYDAVTNSGDHVIVDLITGSADNWNYELVEGIADRQVFQISEDSIEIDLYGSWLEGEISFEDPRIAIEVENSFGFPIEVRLVNVVAVTSAGNEINLTTTNNNFEVNYPDFSEIGEAKKTTFYFDKNNSNIRDILNARPTLLKYQIEGILNPDDADEMGFVTDQSDLTSLVMVELPIYGTASGFTVQTDADMDLQDIENISDAEFKIITDNGLPIDVNLQLFFQDQFGHTIDSLFINPQNLLSSASIDTEGNTTNTTETTTFVDVSKERMLNIQEANKVIINAAFSSANNGATSVRINSTQEVEVRMGVKIGLEN